MRLLKILIGIAVIIFITNLNALVDLFLHPDIPYLDTEHVLVGITTGFFCLIFFILYYFYFKNLQISIQHQKDLIAEREQILKELNSTKDKLFLIIGHDLRSPLSTIIGIAELLIKNNEKYAPEMKLELVRKIHDSSQMTILLLDSLMEWASTQTEELRFNKKCIDLKEIFDEKVKKFEHIAIIKGVKINNAIKESCELEVDVKMIQTVFRNIISNAIKYTESGGEITFSLAKKNSETEIIISDTGIGMSRQQVENLFKMEKVQSTKGTSDERGFGFGLMICKELIEKHGGTIKIESELNKGSNVIITLPG